jgi:hypothetical protein
MANSYTQLGFVKQADGENIGTWGDVLNEQLIDLLDDAIGGYVEVSVASGNVTLAFADGTADNNGRHAVIKFTGSPGTSRTVTLPNKQKTYYIINGSDGSVICTAGAGAATVTIPTSKKTIIYVDGSDEVHDMFSSPSLSDSSVTNAMLAGSIADSKLSTISTAGKVDIGALEIDGATDIGAGLADADLIVVDDGAGGTNRKAAMSRVATYIESGISGDITISSGTAAIGAGVIVNADINSSAAIADSKLATISTADKVSGAAVQIDGATDGTSITIADSDKFLIDDGGTTKYVNASQINAYTSAAVALDDISTGDAAATLATSAGNITIDAQGNDTDIILKGTDGGADTTFLTIDGSAAGAATFNSDVTVGALLKMPDVTSGKILVGDGTSYEEVAVSGDVTIASSGAVTIAASAVENSMLAGSIADSKLNTISTAGKVALTALEIDGGSDIGADLTTSDLIIVDDGAGGTNRKAALSRVVTLMSAQGFSQEDPTALAIALG